MGTDVAEWNLSLIGPATGGDKTDGRGTLPKGGLPLDAQPYSVARRMDTAEVPPAGSSVSPASGLGDQSFVQEFA